MSALQFGLVETDDWIRHGGSVKEAGQFQNKKKHGKKEKRGEREEGKGDSVSVMQRERAG